MMVKLQYHKTKRLHSYPSPSCPVSLFFSFFLFHFFLFLFFLFLFFLFLFCLFAVDFVIVGIWFQFLRVSMTRWVVLMWQPGSTALWRSAATQQDRPHWVSAGGAKTEDLSILTEHSLVHFFCSVHFPHFIHALIFFCCGQSLVNNLINKFCSQNQVYFFTKFWLVFNYF